MPIFFLCLTLVPNSSRLASFKLQNKVVTE